METYNEKKLDAEYCSTCGEHWVPYYTSCNCNKYEYDAEAIDRAIKAIKSAEKE